MHMGIPVKPMLSRNLRLQWRTWLPGWSRRTGPGTVRRRTEAHVGTHGSHLFYNGLMDIHQSLKVSGGIAVGNACDDEQKEDNGDQAL